MIIDPVADSRLEEYYKLRWLLLRKPWGKERGTEIDSLEEASFHRAALIDNQIVGVGRIHFIDKLAQIRYMGVKNEFIGEGLGSKILSELERIAIDSSIERIFLNSREAAIGFYENNGYLKIGKADSDFASIVHYRMEKVLEKL